MRNILEKSIEFYSMLEYFTTKNEDGTTKLPTIPSKPFNKLEPLNIKVIDMVNNKLFSGTKIKCVLINKK